MLDTAVATAAAVAAVAATMLLAVGDGSGAAPLVLCLGLLPPTGLLAWVLLIILRAACLCCPAADDALRLAGGVAG